MIAKVQYNDLVGTAAADISDYYMNSLNEFLSKRFANFDQERYVCEGCEFFTSYGQYPSVRFICRDIKQSTYHLFQPEKDFSLVEFFELFKRFSIVIGKSVEDIHLDKNEQILTLSEVDNAL